MVYKFSCSVFFGENWIQTLVHEWMEIWHIWKKEPLRMLYMKYFISWLVLFSTQNEQWKIFFALNPKSINLVYVFWRGVFFLMGQKNLYWIMVKCVTLTWCLDYIFWFKMITSEFEDGENCLWRIYSSKKWCGKIYSNALLLTNSLWFEYFGANSLELCALIKYIHTSTDIHFILKHINNSRVKWVVYCMYFINTILCTVNDV